MPTSPPIRYLDTETTGFRPGTDEVIEIAIVDAEGTVLLDTLIRPKGKIPPEITKITGITNAMVREAPALDDMAAEIERLLTGAEMVAHNASFDRRMLGRLGTVAAVVTCTMKLAKPFLKGSSKLHDAALAAGHVWSGTAHRALADTLACRSVHLWALERMSSKSISGQSRSREKPESQDFTLFSSASPTPQLHLETTMATDKTATKAAKTPAQSTEMEPVSFPCVTKPNDPRFCKIDRSECPEPTLKGQPWAREDDLKLGELWMKGDGVPSILGAIPRTPVAIFARLHKLGLITQEMNPYYQPPQPFNPGSIW